MRIALDFDGVLSDCGALKTQQAKRLFGLDIPTERFKKELVVKELAGEEDGVLTLAEYRKLQDVIYNDPEVGLTMQPVSGMLEYLPRLLNEEHEVRIVTSRDGPKLDIAKAWTANHALELEFTGVGYGKSKASAVTGFDMFVDDDLDKIEPLISIVRHRFLFSWGYNAHVDVGDVAERIGSWEDLYLAIQEIYAESLQLT